MRRQYVKFRVENSPRARNDYFCVSSSFLSRIRRGAIPVASAAGLLLLGAGPAAAHVEVTSDGPARAGTGPVTLVFMAEAESHMAGIASAKTQLPEGIAPEDVSLVNAPEGWALTPIANGFELGGPAIAPGLDAEYSVAIAHLPTDSTELAFPTLQRYSDGHEEAWIEPVTADVPEPENPAPILTVAPAPQAATSAAPTATATPATSEAADPSASSEASRSSEVDSNTGTIVLIVVLW